MVLDKMASKRIVNQESTACQNIKKRPNYFQLENRVAFHFVAKASSCWLINRTQNCEIKIWRNKKKK